MNFRFRNIFLPLVVGAVVVSCEQKEEEINPDAPMSAETTGKATLANLLHRETFEGSTVFADVHDQFGTSHAFNVASNPVFEGAKSGRFELRDSDPETSNGTRAEVLFPDATHRERWYSFRTYYPSSGYKTDSNNDILNQWHQGSGTGSPSTTLRVRNDRFLLRSGNTVETRKEYDLGVQTKDVWHEFVFHIIHSNGSDGLIEVWHNGKKVLTRTGGNMYDAKLPRWKVGIYKDDWNGSETTDSKLRIFYVDDLRVGNEKATFADMSSGDAATTAPAPTEPVASDPAATAPVETAPTTGTSSGAVNFTLIDAHTEKGVMAITDGATISLASLANTKLNIQANAASSTGSVKMELSGAQSKTYVDSAAPFALHGDSGSGNFYYGNWNPPAAGTYTLKATPYSGSNATGTAGTPVTIRFTIVK